LGDTQLVSQELAHHELAKDHANGTGDGSRLCDDPVGRGRDEIATAVKRR
jgi:hypothetical protein